MGQDEKGRYSHERRLKLITIYNQNAKCLFQKLFIFFGEYCSVSLAMASGSSYLSRAMALLLSLVNCMEPLDVNLCTYSVCPVMSADILIPSQVSFPSVQQRIHHQHLHLFQQANHHLQPEAVDSHSRLHSQDSLD